MIVDLKEEQVLAAVVVDLVDNDTMKIPMLVLFELNLYFPQHMMMMEHYENLL